MSEKTSFHISHPHANTPATRKTEKPELMQVHRENCGINVLHVAVQNVFWYKQIQGF